MDFGARTESTYDPVTLYFITDCDCQRNDTIRANWLIFQNNHVRLYVSKVQIKGTRSDRHVDTDIVYNPTYWQCTLCFPLHHDDFE